MHFVVISSLDTNEFVFEI